MVGTLAFMSFTSTSTRASGQGLAVTRSRFWRLSAGWARFPSPSTTAETLGPLDPTLIATQPPNEAAVELFKPDVVAAIGRRARALNFQNRGDVSIDHSRRVVGLGTQNTISGNVTFGDVAMGNITKITITTSSHSAASVDSVDAVRKVIASLRDDLGKLPGASKYDLGDADDELRKAQEACEDKARTLEKLESAQKILLKIGGAAEGGVKLAENVGLLIQRLAFTPA